jgi:EAL domain-containing protein (putative c-di-GMP-specific phosphodiesterase class I)
MRKFERKGIDSFIIAYQPIIDLKNGKIYGYEALLRPKREKPEEFIKKAKMSGRLLELERLICHTIAQQKSKRNDDSEVFINLTPYSFAYSDGIVMIDALSLINQAKVVIEITEAMRLPNNISKTANVWRDRGYRLAIDDITKGYSRLSAVAEIMPDFIKIDRKCIASASKSGTWEKILEGIVNMARSINAKTIGEGVETNEEKELILKYGVDFGQGYYFGKPAIIENVS